MYTCTHTCLHAMYVRTGVRTTTTFPSRASPGEDYDFDHIDVDHDDVDYQDDGQDHDDHDQDQERDGRLQGQPE